MLWFNASRIFHYYISVRNCALKQKIVFVVLLSFLLTACSKDQESEREYPRVKTLEVNGISEGGARFRADILTQGNAEIIDHGFLWGQSENSLSYSNSDRVSLGSFSGTGIFEKEISTTLVKDREYFVKSFVKTSAHMVYGAAVSFVSLGSEAPLITGFEPKNAGWGDTVLVRSQNFSLKPESNKVYFGIVISSIVFQNLEHTDSSLYVLVPPLLNDTKSILSVELAGNISTFTQDTFKLIPPTITGFKPKQAHWGDTIVVYGKHLNSVSQYSSQNFFAFNTIKCQSPIYSSRDSVYIIVPPQLNISHTSLSATINGQKYNASGTFRLLPPEISDFNPKTATWDDKITLYGKFNTDSKINEVAFNTYYKSTIINTSRDSLVVKVPFIFSPYSTITYKAHSFTAQSSQYFQLLAPEIEDFSPTSGAGGEVVTIKAKNFYPDSYHTHIYFGDTYSAISSINSTTIKCIVPNNIAGRVKIKLVCGKLSAESEDYFSVTNPLITEFSPKTATFWDTITIYGENFDANPSSNTVQFVGLNPYENYGGYANVVSASPTMLKVLVPDDLSYAETKIKVQVGSIYSYSNDIFSLLPPIVSSFSPETGGSNVELSIYGNNFAPNQRNRVQIGNVYGSVKSSSKNTIVANFTKLTRGNHKVKVFFDNLIDESPQYFNCTSPWLSLPSPTTYMYQGHSFDYNGIGYIFESNKIYSFNATSNSWAVKEIPFLLLYNTTYFRYLNRSYRVCGIWGEDTYNTYNTNAAYFFNQEANEWVRLNDFPGEIRFMGFTFSFPNKAFVGGGSKYDFWEYNPVDDSWEQKSDTPFTTYHGTSVSAMANSKGYVILQNRSVWEYNPNDDEWTKKSDFPGSGRYKATGFAIGSIIYYGTGSEGNWNWSYGLDDLWAYETQTDTWVRKTSVPGPLRVEANSFAINGKGYIGFGRDHNSYWSTNDFYEYDPSRDND